MENKLPLSVTIITLNEEKSIAKAIQSVNFASECIVVDSQSTDQTVKIAESLGAKVVQQKFLGFGQQKNFAQSLCKEEWVLNLDADERVSEKLAQEIQAFFLSPKKDEYSQASFPRLTYYLNRWIKHGGWYPNRLIRMAKKNSSRWTEPEVHEELKSENQEYRFLNDLYHFSFESIADQVTTNIKYAKLGAKKVNQEEEWKLCVKIIFKPIGKFFETYFWKLGFLDGWAGLIISVNASHSMFMKYTFALESRMKNEKNTDSR